MVTCSTRPSLLPLSSPYFSNRKDIYLQTLLQPHGLPMFPDVDDHLPDAGVVSSTSRALVKYLRRAEEAPVRGVVSWILPGVSIRAEVVMHRVLLFLFSGHAFDLREPFFHFRVHGVELGALSGDGVQDGRPAREIGLQIIRTERLRLFVDGTLGQRGVISEHFGL